MTANVVLVTGSLHGGGAERVLCEMANYWAKKGWEVTFATWSGPEIDDFYELDTGSNRVWLDVTTPANSVVGKARQILQRMITFRKLLVDLQPDAVLSFMNSSNVLTILAAAGLKTKVVVSERVQPSADPTVSSVVRFLRRITYPWSDEIVVQSKDAAKWIRRHCRKQATVISNPLRFLSQVECDRQPLIVSVGRLVHQKGFDLLLRAFAKIAPEYSDWNVAIVGEGCERENLIRLCDELALGTRVRFVGQVRDVETWMGRAGLVVQPSRFEGFPNVLLESMGMGAPVISADCPSGPGEIIQDGVNGRLVPVDDVAALADVMAELISQPETRKRLGEKAAEVRQQYRQDLIMEQWEACLLAGRGNLQSDDTRERQDAIER